ncbi:MAG: hypothetical protein WD944_06500 [Steroidobacteraceae bacterium]
MNAPEAVDRHALLEAPATRETAPATLEQLRTERIAGRVTDSDFFPRMDYLARVKAGEDVQVPNLHPTMEQKFAQQHDELMRPGQPHEFRLERDPALPPLDEAGLEHDAEIREALSAAQIPPRLASTLMERVDHVAKIMGDLSPDDREIKAGAMRADLQQKWGADYKANVELVSDFVARAAEKSPLLGDILDHAPFLLADTYLAESLLSIATFQAARRK